LKQKQIKIVNFFKTTFESKNNENKIAEISFLLSNKMRLNQKKMENKG
jgi:hypothetical protein